jgi:hypothetical protein
MSDLDQDIMFTLVREPIFLTETHIAGLRYTPDLGDIMAGIKEGTTLRAFLEVDNEYDEDAVVIVDDKDRKVGHVPRPSNRIIANLIRAGKDIECEVEAVGTLKGEPNVRVSIYMMESRPSGRGSIDVVPRFSATPETANL